MPQSHVNRPRQPLPPEKQELEDRIIEALRRVYDPEIPINIYDFGLIYEVLIDDDNAVKVRMMLTAPGCPVAGSLPLEVEARVQAVPQVKSCVAELVWDPPWHREMMSEAARLELGL